MNVAASSFVLILTLSATLFAILAVETRSLVKCTYWYVAHSCCLIFTYVTYGVTTGNSYLYIWAGLCVVNTWLLPFLQGGLRYTARRVQEEERVSHAATALFAIVAFVSVAFILWRSSLTLTVAGSPLDNLDRTVSASLACSLLLFIYGTIVLLTHRHLFKLALGLLIMTSGAHLTLVQMAPSFFSMVEIEILTKVMGTVFAMLYAARLLAERFQSADAARLVESDRESMVL